MQHDEPSVEGLAAGCDSAAPPQADPLNLREGAVVFVDLQNFHNFLSDQCGTNPFRLNLVDFIHAWAGQYRIQVAEIRVYTGIHSEQREPAKAAATAKRLAWMAHQGVKVFKSTLAYSMDPRTGEWRPREKGVDVRMAAELVQLVACEGVNKVLLITQDNDLSQAVDVASTICMSRGEQLLAYSPELKDRSRVSGRNKCGWRGIHCTERLDVPLWLVDEHSVDHRPPRPIEPSCPTSDAITEADPSTLEILAREAAQSATAARPRP